MASTYDKFSAWAELALGVSLVLRGVTEIAAPHPAEGLLGRAPQARRPQGRPGLGRAAPQVASRDAVMPDGRLNAQMFLPASRQQGRIVTNVRTEDVRTIEQRVARIRTLIQKGSRSPMVREKALSVLTRKCNGKWCTPEKNYRAEISALFEAVRDPRSPLALRYTRDHVAVDQFHSADKLFRLKGGDCDDGTILLGSMLMSVGYNVKMRVIQDTKSDSWSHIYLTVQVGPGGEWMPLDWSVSNAHAGWEVPGAKEVALNGRPAGLVTKLRDFDV